MTFVAKKELVATADSESDAILAVWSSVSPWSPCSLLSIMFWVSSHVKTARFDAIVMVESMVVDGMMSALTRLILGFGIMYIRSSGDIKVQKCPCVFKRLQVDRTPISLLAVSPCEARRIGPDLSAEKSTSYEVMQ